MPELLVPVVNELPTGLVAVPLPTPYRVGTVNCWILPEHPITVIDPGMVFADSTDTLTTALHTAGVSPEEVEVIVVTHAHPDHYGAAGWLSELAGVPVHAGRAEVPKLTGERDFTGMAALIGVFGIPAEALAGARDHVESIGSHVQAIAPDRTVAVDDGDVLVAGGRRFTAMVTPGHAPGHVSLWDAEGSRLFSGDHLLPSITPNPLVEPDPTSSLGRRRSLVEYLGSLARFEVLAPEVSLPGHGPAFGDLPRLVRTTRAHHEDRAAEILSHITSLGEPSAYELSRAVFPHIEGGPAIMLAISEVVGHVDLLVEAGQVVTDDGPPTRYRAV